VEEIKIEMIKHELNPEMFFFLTYVCNEYVKVYPVVNRGYNG